MSVFEMSFHLLLSVNVAMLIHSGEECSSPAVAELWGSDLRICGLQRKTIHFQKQISIVPERTDIDEGQ